ncbi:uncharacterized protein LOC123300570 [Chrysoperla carnea]|uniref:uncharacterized protein LOC123300570 n=1 Tax=Chrysoperla carnea TaxID=189513 RepID=UPI001D091031|nr:uncharacterized protein LOC123300570 [Chrysoperla carnea]
MNNYFIVILLFSTIISITSGKTFLDGKRVEEDRLVYHRFIRAPSNPLLKLTRQVIYPERNIYKRLQAKLVQRLPTITQINITDIEPSHYDSYGIVSVIAGGPGHQYVIIELKSEMGRPLNYEITIHAMYTY